MKLTKSQIRYMVAIRRLSSGNGGVRPSDIASLLDVKRPSVTGMLDILCSMDLIFRKSDGVIYFTDACRFSPASIRKTVRGPSLVDTAPERG